MLIALADLHSSAGALIDGIPIRTLYTPEAEQDRAEAAQVLRDMETLRAW